MGKYCVDCKWMLVHEDGLLQYFCNRPGLGISMVTDKKIIRNCGPERAYPMIDGILCCGQEGKFFEEIDESRKGLNHESDVCRIPK